MLRKTILLAVLVAAAALALWRLGLLDRGRVKDEAAELRERAEKGAKRASEEAGKTAREAVQDATRR